MIHPLKFIVNFKEVLLLDQLTSCAVVLTILDDNELAIDEALALSATFNECSLNAHRKKFTYK